MNKTLGVVVGEPPKALKQIRTIIREENEPINKRLDGLEQGQKRLEQGQERTNKDIAVLKNGQAHNTTMLEAVLAGQQELQKTAAREVTVMKFAERLTRKVHDHEERITDLEKEAGIPHLHKH